MGLIEYTRRAIGFVGLAALLVAGCRPAPSPEAAPAVLPPPVQGEDTPEAVAQPLTVRHEMPPFFTPGALNEFSATIDYTGSDPVTALAVQVTLPPEWQYGGISGSLRPAVEPAAGARGDLTFIWIQIPSFPATLEYVIDVPPASGPGSVTVQAIYRRLGGQEESPAVEIALSPVAPV